MKDIVVLGAKKCNYCEMSKALLNAKGIDYTYKDIEEYPEEYERMMLQQGLRSVPQIWFGSEYVGGFDKLMEKLQ